MKFGLILEELLLELSAQEIYQKYYKDVDYNTFQQISLADPKTVEENGEIKSLGKYVKLLVDLYKRKRIDLEDLPNAKEYLTHIYERNIPVDIGKIKGIPDLYELVKSFIVASKPKIDEILKALNENEYKILFNGENWYIFQPLTEKAACYLGVGSTWCTTWGPLSLNKEYKDRENRFEGYSRTDTIYILINKVDSSLKYQFHFGEKQFMNIENRQINTESFLNENPEIKYFFFPSLIRDDVETEEMDLQIKRMKILPQEDKQILLNKIIKLRGGNKIIDAITNDDEEMLQTLIFGEPNDKIRLTGDLIIFNVNSLDDQAEQISNTIDYYQYDMQDSFSRVYEDLRDRFDEEWWRGFSEKTLDTYYNQNKSSIASNLGFLSVDSFKEYFLDSFYENEKIKDAAIDYMAESASESYSILCRERINEYIDYISFDRRYNSGYDININKVYFSQFLGETATVSMEFIEGRGDDGILEIVEEFIEHYNLNTEYEGIYDYDFDEPEYSKESTSTFTTRVESFFEIEEENMEGECKNTMKKFNEIKQKLFNNSNQFENDDVLVRLNSIVDCSDNTVDITFTNKNTGKMSRGKVKVENIPNYVTNYALFESLVSFKKLIK
jgi:hypothetical protein